ncbi:diaminopimelate epimerase [Thermosulfurimonas marina]|uniref:Diaminopimelate epimerase n=1 Tax=Thermosulfurimonas marina TaxID=2047767 RepID=A0A6H1WRX4_9BACT|nr:diaminopimelate epimerase [Thermosulfurimonas marina]QJA05931.1 diaminopimelate epimerase [Thermosulfurimonas marina]
MFPELSFVKMQASGNDFLLINNFSRRILPEEAPVLARRLCRRRLSVGADGLILLEPPEDPTHAFRWRFFNADGSEAEMCGNGGRCAARFAVEEGLARPVLSFETRAGIIRARVQGSRVKVALTPPKDLSLGLKLLVEGKPLEVHFVNTGVPHAVVLVEDLEAAPVNSLGPALRYHERFSPAGTNVNFVEILSEEEIAVRTYERGVEGETLACGTGAAASALIAAELGKVRFPVRIRTRGGEILTIHREETLFLEGETRRIYRGLLHPEALLD